MGSVIQLKKQINNSYLDLRNSVEEKLVLVDEKIVSKLSSNVDLVRKMTEYHLGTGGKKLRALLITSSLSNIKTPFLVYFFAIWLATLARVFVFATPIETGIPVHL